VLGASAEPGTADMCARVLSPLPTDPPAPLAELALAGGAGVICVWVAALSASARTAHRQSAARRARVHGRADQQAGATRRVAGGNASVATAACVAAAG
jgi:hypothetical protein